METDFFDDKTIPLYDQVKISIFRGYINTLYYYNLFICKETPRNKKNFETHMKSLYLLIRPKLKKKIDILERSIFEEYTLTNLELCLKIAEIGEILENSLGITKTTYTDIKNSKAYKY